MKTIRFFTKSSIMAIIFSLSFLSFSCEQDDTTIKTKNYDSKELFKSIMFLDGKYTKDFSLLNEIRNNYSKEQHHDYTFVLDKLIKQNPTYLENFKQDMISKDHDRIKNSLVNAATLIQGIEKDSELENNSDRFYIYVSPCGPLVPYLVVFVNLSTNPDIPGYEKKSDLMLEEVVRVIYDEI